MLALLLRRKWLRMMGFTRKELKSEHFDLNIKYEIEQIYHMHKCIELNRKRDKELKNET